jgi:hypothetical protein
MKEKKLISETMASEHSNTIADIVS